MLSETLALAALLAVLSVAAYGANTIHGGFLMDSWSWRAFYEFAPGEGFLGGTQHLLDQPPFGSRPLQAIQFAALNGAFGSHMGFWLAWLGVLAVVMSLSLYVLMRELKFSPVDAAIVATLVLVFPAAGSLRFWTATSASQLTIILAIAGFIVALHAFDGPRRRGVVLHIASLVLFVTSLLVYDSALPLMLASGLIYRLKVTWRPALRRWALDVGVLITGVLALRHEASYFPLQSAGGTWDHAWSIANQACVLFTTTVLPFGSASWQTVTLIVLVPITAVLVMGRLAPTEPARAALRHWLGVLVGGLVVVALGYAIYAPGLDFYSPTSPGMGDRINAVPSIGWVLMLYATIVLMTTMAFRGLPRAGAVSRSLALLACVVVGTSWLSSLSDQSDAYQRAYREGLRTLQTIRTSLPAPVARSTIWAFDIPGEVAPGIPVFADRWNMTNSVRLGYGDPSLNAYVVFPGTVFRCGADAVRPGGSPLYQIDYPGYNNSYASPYGRTYFLSTTSGKWKVIRTPRECSRAARTFL